MTVTLYDLAAAEEDRRFSPFCWRTRLALAHKGLDVETVPWRFTDKEAIAFSGQGRVPVIRDGERAVSESWTIAQCLSDSWTIAQYLEDAYPDRPSLFGGAAGRALARFYNDWADTVLHPGIIRFVLLDIFRHLAPQDRDYFRRSREERFGTTLEDFVADREARLPAFRQSLTPLRQTLKAQPYLGGTAPLYPDYIVFGSFQWARAISDFPLLEPDDPIARWRGRLLDAFDGLARRAPGYD
jgi:glutathione S-transferase